MSMVMSDGYRLVDDSADTDGAERRRGLRILSNRPVKVLNPAGGKYFGGETKDVSSTGLRLELPAHAMVRCGEQLSIHVGLGADGSMLANRRQMIPTTVVWVNSATAMRKSIMVGVEFASSISAQLDAAEQIVFFRPVLKPEFKHKSFCNGSPCWHCDCIASLQMIWDV